MTTSAISGQNNISTVLSNQGGSFGENQFLRLLTTQLQNQSPLEPVDNESFMNQMASYSSMEQQQDLNTNMMALLDYQGLLARMQGLSQGSALLGKQVAYKDENGADADAVVESVFVAESGDVRLRLEGGDEIGLRDVHGIADAQQA
ncbi:MAG: flagellar hook capping FlgD N-terminal domain-containing protein [Planctomycetota bacterium]